MSGEKVRYAVADAVGALDVARRLGLSRLLEAGLRVGSVEVVGETLRMRLEWPGVGAAILTLMRADGGPRFCGTARVSVVAEGEEVARPFATVMRRIAAAAGDATIDELCAIVAPPLDAATAGEFPGSPISSWGGDREEPGPGPDKPDGEARESPPEAATAFPRAGRTFFCDHAIQRKLFESFRFEGPSSCIVHGDLECSFITPRARAPLPRFFNYPSPLQGEPERFGTTTDLQDLDVIEGGADKLEGMIRDEVASVGAAGPVTINTTCIPTIIGDDVEAVVRRHAGDTGHGVWLVGPRTLEPVDLYMRYLERARERHAGEGRQVAPGRVALVGFAEGRPTDEIEALLAACGVEVAGRMLPVASEGRMREALDAGVLVFRPSTYHQPLYDRVFAGVDRVRVTPDAPWGVEATAAWVRAIAAATDRADEAEGALAGRLAAMAPAWDRLRAEVASRAAAFVIDPSESARLLDPHSMTGLPVAPLVAAMGFETRVLVYAGHAAAFRDCRDRVAAALGPAVKVAGFATQEELAAGLLEPVPAIVYSEFFYDRRLTRLGLHGFSSRDFEMGLDGAVRSLRRLARLAASPFYRAYARHMGRPSAAWWWD